MKKKLLFCFLLTIIMLCGCMNDAGERGIDGGQEQTAGEFDSLGEDQVCKGWIRVKFKREPGDRLEITKTRSGGIVTHKAALDEFLTRAGVTEMRRVFPYAGKFEARTRYEGLHLWYDIKYDESTSGLTRAVNDAMELPEIEYASPIYKPRISDVRVVDHTSAGTFSRASTGRSDILPFDDPHLPIQWHYNNTGNTDLISDAVAGADINLFEAWKTTTGKSNVAVAVVDLGVDITHYDLKDRIYQAPGEIYCDAADNDDNGYAGDAHGWNFFSYAPKIVPGIHGTHVAGTIGATNNNGIGVAGVAGGNAKLNAAEGEEGSGVRIISCQIFDPGGNMTSVSRAAEAIKYGADRGALISQNSWGFYGNTKTPKEITEAINYFIKYAGCEAEPSDDPRQLPDSPMKGGVVIFAAGNEMSETSYPGFDSPQIIAVSAHAPDYTMSYYTNRGAWVDICAPGGSERYYNKYVNNGTVYSTSLNNGYAGLQGTSMACPHVSGIAALILSVKGGPGFTCDHLKEMIVNGVSDVNIDDVNEIRYAGMLGKGFADAVAALNVVPELAPDAPVFVKTITSGNSITVQWKAVREKQGKANKQYNIYVSESKMSKESDLVGADHFTVPHEGYSEDDIVEYKATGLKEYTLYYFAVTAENTNGQKSEIMQASGTTHGMDNTPPNLKRALSNQVIGIGETKSLTLTDYFGDDDGDELSFECTADDGSVVEVSTVGDVLTLRGLKAGSSKVKIKATDESKSSAEGDFTVSVSTGGNFKLIDKIYPVPVEATLTVEFNAAVSGEVKITVRNNIGHFISGSTHNTANGNKAIVGMRNDDPGTYILTVEFGGKTEQKVFLKQ